MFLPLPQREVPKYFRKFLYDQAHVKIKPYSIIVISLTISLNISSQKSSKSIFGC